MAPASNDVAGLVRRLERLAEDFEDDHTPEFIKHLEHPDENVRVAAVRGLWDSPPGEVREQLFRLLDKDASEEVRATAVGVMGRYIYEGLLLTEAADPSDIWEIRYDDVVAARQRLDAILFDNSSPILLRRRALEALSFDPGPEEITLMQKWIRHPDPNVRMSTVFSMGRSELEQWDDAIIKALEDSSLEVRREAIRAIAEAELAEGIPALAVFLEGESRELKMEAIVALGRVGGSDALTFLRQMAGSDDDELAELVCEATENAESLSVGFEAGFDAESEEGTLNADDFEGGAQE